MARKRSTARRRTSAGARREPRVRAGGSHGIPRTRRELAHGVFDACNPVAVGRDLLRAESESVKARAFETLADWMYGPEGAAGGNAAPGGVHIVWDLPAPSRESH